MLLKLINIEVKTQNLTILKNLNLQIKLGETHIIMGPNGSGKSTIGKIISGHQDYNITEGQIIFNNKDLNKLKVEERAASGIFVSFQQPIEIPGLNNTQFIKTSINSINKYNNKPEINIVNFMKELKNNMKLLEIKDNYMHRGVNENFSGGEKKKNEILQMMMIKPQLCILDEIDSGLDIDALKCISKNINNMKNNNRSFIIITHYHKFLDLINPDYIHILINGNIVKSGTNNISQYIEKYGYKFYEKNNTDK